MEQSLLIGKKVKFQVSSNNEKEGVVIDKVLMKEKAGSDITVTGYIIEVENELYNNIHHWRIVEILD